MSAGYVRSWPPPVAGPCAVRPAAASEWEPRFDVSALRLRSSGVLADAAAKLDVDVIKMQASSAELWAALTPRRGGSQPATPRQAVPAPGGAAKLADAPPSDPFGQAAAVVADLAGKANSLKSLLPVSRTAAPRPGPGASPEPEAEASPEAAQAAQVVTAAEASGRPAPEPRVLASAPLPARPLRLDSGELGEGPLRLSSATLGSAPLPQPGLSRMTSAPVPGAGANRSFMLRAAQLRSPSCSEDDKGTLIKRMRARRHLEDALSEGQRAAVLEAAVKLAKEAACSPHRLDAAEAKLGLVRELEDAMASADAPRLQEVLIQGARGGINAHVALACEGLPQEIVRCVEEVVASLPSSPKAGTPMGATASRSSLGSRGSPKGPHLLRDPSFHMMSSTLSKDSSGPEATADAAAEAAAKEAAAARERRAREAAARQEAQREQRRQAARAAAEGRLRAAGDLASLQAALEASRDVGVDDSIIRDYEAALQSATAIWEAIQQAFAACDCRAAAVALERAKGPAGMALGGVKLSGCERALLWLRQFDASRFANGFRFPADVALETVSKAIADFRSLVDAGSSLLQPLGLDGGLAAAARELPGLAALEALAAVVARSSAVNLETDDFEVLTRAKTEILDAIKDATQAGLSESHVAFADFARRRIHSAIQDRKGVVRVFCRIRPPSLEEVASGMQVVVRVTDPYTVELDQAQPDAGAKPPVPSASARSSSLPGTPRGSLTPRSARSSLLGSSREEPKGQDAFGFFDACWAPGSQEQVFDHARELVQSAVDGNNLTIFTYGQTGAGKTYTMYGKWDIQGNSARRSARGSQLFQYSPIGRQLSSGQRQPPNVPSRPRTSSRVGGPELARAASVVETAGEDPGICMRVAGELFRLLEQGEPFASYSVTFAMVELYCQRYIDLLDPQAEKSLKQRTTPEGEVYLENLREEPVASPEDFKRWLAAGARERHQRETACNTDSSRSHTICIVKVTTESRETGLRRRGKMLLVDLAGSERVKRSEVAGAGMREAIEVNRSLSALGDVLAALVRGEQHIPYRNHELTQLMQDSIGGSAKTLMFLNLSPSPWHLDETRVSLEFAQRIKSVVNKPQGGGQARGSVRRASGLSTSPGAGRRRSSLLAGPTRQSPRIPASSSLYGPPRSIQSSRSRLGFGT